MHICACACVCVCQVVEAGLGHLPFAERIVRTPTGDQYVGVELATTKLCGVSIIRSGEVGCLMADGYDHRALGLTQLAIYIQLATMAGGD